MTIFFLNVWILITAKALKCPFSCLKNTLQNWLPISFKSARWTTLSPFHLHHEMEKKRNASCKICSSPLAQREGSPWGADGGLSFPLAWGNSRAEDRKKKTKRYGLLWCLICGSMTPSPCQPLLSPWKPALLDAQDREKPFVPRCGVCDSQSCTASCLVSLYKDE